MSSARAYDAEEDADDLLDEAERSIFQIAEHRMRPGFIRVGELVDSGYQLIEQLQQQRGWSPACRAASSISTR